MFKKFATLLAPLVLTSLGSLFTNSAAHASTSWTGWTGWQSECYYTIGDRLVKTNYNTPWRALIEHRFDGAARAIQVQYGDNKSNNERIYTLILYESKKEISLPPKVDEREEVLPPPVRFLPNGQTVWTSPTTSFLPFISSPPSSPTISVPTFKRLINAQFVRTIPGSNQSETCKSTIAF